MFHNEMLHTIDYVPGQEIDKSLGMIGALGFPSLEKVQSGLILRAKTLGADAVIGVQFIQNSENGLINAFGTAVTFR